MKKKIKSVTLIRLLNPLKLTVESDGNWKGEMYVNLGIGFIIGHPDNFIIEYEPEGAKVKQVKVIKCDNDASWYQDKIGWIFNVEPDERDNAYWKVLGLDGQETQKLIKWQNAELLS